LNVGELPAVIPTMGDEVKSKDRDGDEQRRRDGPTKTRAEQTREKSGQTRCVCFPFNLAQHTLADSGIDRITERRRRKLLQQLARLVIFGGPAGTLCTGLNVRRYQPRAFFFEVPASVERQQFLDLFTIH